MEREIQAKGQTKERVEGDPQLRTRPLKSLALMAAAYKGRLNKMLMISKAACDDLLALCASNSSFVQAAPDDHP